MDDAFPPDFMQHVGDFFVEDASRPKGLDSYDAVFASPGFFPLQRRRELEQVIALLRARSPKVVYEIGADKGASLYHWIKCLPTVERVIACEIRGTPYRHLFEAAFPEIDFLWIEDSSYSRRSFNSVKDWLGSDRLDMLFIDGDKLRYSVDFSLYGPLVKSGGLVFLHDVEDPPIALVWQAITKKFKTSHIVDRSEGLAAATMELTPEDRGYLHWLKYWKGQSCTVGVVYL